MVACAQNRLFPQSAYGDPSAPRAASPSPTPSPSADFRLVMCCRPWPLLGKLLISFDFELAEFSPQPPAQNLGARAEVFAQPPETSPAHPVEQFQRAGDATVKCRSLRRCHRAVFKLQCHRWLFLPTGPPFRPPPPRCKGPDPLALHCMTVLTLNSYSFLRALKLSVSSRLLESRAIGFIPRVEKYLSAMLPTSLWTSSFTLVA